MWSHNKDVQKQNQIRHTTPLVQYLALHVVLYGSETWTSTNTWNMGDEILQKNQRIYKSGQGQKCNHTDAVESTATARESAAAIYANLIRIPVQNVQNCMPRLLHRYKAERCCSTATEMLVKRTGTNDLNWQMMMIHITEGRKHKTKLNIVPSYIHGAHFPSKI